MAYIEAWTICEGALSDEDMFDDATGLDVDGIYIDAWLKKIEDDANEGGVVIEVYLLTHGHNADVSECDCVQYETSHLPDYTFGQ